jgi:diguanylate cyclase (GGDEF)-like protein/putative nucleotidyltransferase with HDIG domain
VITDPRASRRRSKLLLVVFGASLMLVIVTAGALAWLVSDHVTSAAIESSVSSDRALVRSFVATTLRPSDLAGAVDAARTAEVGRDLAQLLDRDGTGLVQIKVHALDGTVLFSDDPAVVGTAGEGDELDEAIDEAEPAVGLETVGEGDSGSVKLPVGAAILETYLPVVADGRVVAVFEVYRNAAPILGHIDATRRDVILVTTSAAIVLAVLLYLIFRAAQRRLTRQTAELVEATRRDALTGLYNHGSMVGALAAMLDGVRDSDASVAVALLDIDNFRLLNDTHGHAAGDAALRKVAAAMNTEIAPPLLVGRFGPDEFLVIAPVGSSTAIDATVDRVRERLSGLSLQFGTSERLPLTTSAAICHAPQHGRSAAELLSVATATLAEAKASGGNAVRVAEHGADEVAAASRTSFDILSGLVIAVDTKDRYTKQHSEDVARYALFLAGRMGVDADTRRAIRAAGLLHDVGKIGIPDVILRKPARLTDDEYAIVKQHVALGALIVRDVPDIDIVRAGVRHHHERWDGNGYLDRLSGDDIPLVARILAVADAFSAMTTSRPYRKALTVGEALRRLEDAAGTQLDSRLVKTFVEGIETATDAPLPGDGRSQRIWTPGGAVA